MYDKNNDKKKSVKIDTILDFIKERKEMINKSESQTSNSFTFPLFFYNFFCFF